MRPLGRARIRGRNWASAGYRVSKLLVPILELNLRIIIAGWGRLGGSTMFEASGQR